MGGEDSLTVKSDFFVKTSVRQHQKRLRQERPCVGSPEETNETCSPLDPAANIKSPQQLKRKARVTAEKQRRNSTPEKIFMKSGAREECSEQLSSDPTNNELTSHEIPNLRLEAKMSNEENSRIFAGRQMHPFFSYWKMVRRNQETADSDDNSCYIERKEKGISFGPIHVFEKDDAVSLDWGNWIFLEKSLDSTSSDLETLWLPVYERFVKCLEFDNFSTVSDPNKTSETPNEDYLDQRKEAFENHLHSQHDCLDVIPPNSLANEQAGHYKNMPMEVDHEPEKKMGENSFSDYVGYDKKLDIEWQAKFLRESQPENSLWTNKYQPAKAIEVCGNNVSVKYLNEWLRLWCESGVPTSKNSFGADVQDDTFDCYENDSDSESMGEENNLKNVLLVTGPVGSGKSAAIYACAKEQGFQVIEVNASDWRSGALVKQKFGEAVGSHWLQCTWDSPAHIEKQRSISTPATPITRAAEGSNNEVIELLPIFDGKDYPDISGTPAMLVCRDNKSSKSQSGAKTLVLFEDVDVTLHEDRGFIAAIQQLAEAAKRPMILTSNSNSCILPNNLDRLELRFTKPSSKELLCLLNAVCAAENAIIEPCFVERFIHHCKGDIRKTIMHLQFWCQGQSFRKGGARRKHGPGFFDIDAGHCMLQKIIPWECSSQLSESVDKAISRSFIVEDSNFMDKIEEEELGDSSNEKILRKDNFESESIEAKKEAMLNRHCSTEDANVCAVQVDCTCQFSGSSGSPVAFARRNIQRRKLYAVLSSDSEGECFNDGSLVLKDKQFVKSENGALLEVGSMCPYQPIKRCCYSLSEQLPQPQREILVGESCCYSGTAICSTVSDRCKSPDISHVPESLLIPETQMDNQTALHSVTMSPGRVADGLEAVSTFFDLIPNFLSDGNSLDECTQELRENLKMLGKTFDINVESIHGEEVGDTNIVSAGFVPKQYQVMDECSQMDFSRVPSSAKKSKSEVVIDRVQETWRNLRDNHSNLLQYVTSEEKHASQALELCHAMSDLISEADLLFRDCKPIIQDFMEPSLTLSEESDLSSWHENQLQMTSTLAVHGICYYAKEVAALGSNIGLARKVDLAWEMLASSNSTSALGKLVGQDKRIILSSEMGSLRSGSSLKSELQSCLCSIVQSIVPSRSFLASKGGAFHEYICSLCQISRYEASRIAQSNAKWKIKRTRVARHYLSTGALMISPENISLLSQYNCFGEALCESGDTTLR